MKRGIVRVRLKGQIKTIQAMSALLESYEHDSNYRQSRQKSYNTYSYRNQNANSNVHKQVNNHENKTQINFVRNPDNN